MSLVYTVTRVSPEFNDWAGTANTGPIRYYKFGFTDSNGGEGTGSFGRKPSSPAPEAGFKFVAGVAEFSESHNEWKFKQVKTPEQAEKYGNDSGGNFGGGKASDDKMRSKEQCMRGEAIVAACSMSKSPEEAITYAAKLLAYIENGVAAPPAPAPDPLPSSSSDDIPF